MTTKQASHARKQHTRLAALFPDNVYLQRLVLRTEELGIHFSDSPIEEQWLYHPEHRTIFVWEPDLTQQSLSYLVVILAHELGHAVDFDRNPLHVSLTRNMHWQDVPDEIEIAAFVQGYRILKELWIPVSMDQYKLMISPPLGEVVRQRVEKSHICCLLSRTPQAAGTSAAAAQAAS